MTKKLKISIGSHRDTVQVAYVNDSSRPTIINSDLFVGRVLVKIRDFDGITPDGSPPIRDHVYFDGRSRRFDIQIEGRFKRRPGVELYSGEEIHFGRYLILSSHPLYFAHQPLIDLNIVDLNLVWVVILIISLNSQRVLSMLGCEWLVGLILIRSTTSVPSAADRLS